MKKYLVGLFVIIAAISFTAFTNNSNTAEKKLAPVYWFYVESGEGGDGVYTNSTATFAGYQENPPNMSCSGTGYHCVVKFAPEDLNIITAGVEAEIDDNGGTSPKTPLSGGLVRGTP